MKLRGPRSGFRSTIPVRRRLRHELTAAEQAFWRMVRLEQFHDLKLREQHGIGPYVVDFYCAARKLVVEIDGDTHAGSRSEADDAERTRYLEQLGYTVVRYHNRDVLTNFAGVYDDLTRRLFAADPLLSSPSRGGGAGSVPVTPSS